MLNTLFMQNGKSCWNRNTIISRIYILELIFHFRSVNGTNVTSKYFLIGKTFFSRRRCKIAIWMR